MSDHERIWLQHPSAEEFQEEGRLWCQDKVWPTDEDDKEPTEYVRADLYAALRRTVEELAGLLRRVTPDDFEDARMSFDNWCDIRAALARAAKGGTP